uniref:REST corepressor 3 n=1 Tax=Molossus molossus TaxID=27622 RepID=A0A7J8CT99_MOLMO|nr:REST corepressor 3 [Molossus molossus]
MPGMMEKGPELLGKNRSANGSAKSPAGGGGSGASSTNGGLHFSEPESGCSSDDEHDVGMRVGAEYQARIPEFDPVPVRAVRNDVHQPFEEFEVAALPVPGERVK